MSWTLKTGDLEPAVLVVVTSGGRPLAISSAIAARFVMRSVDGAVVVSGTATILDDGVDPDTLGLVSYSWDTGETDVAGSYQAEVEVEWSAGRTQTFPPEGFLSVRIEDDLG